jgi:hypothetical protein
MADTGAMNWPSLTSLCAPLARAVLASLAALLLPLETRPAKRATMPSAQQMRSAFSAPLMPRCSRTKGWVCMGDLF